MTHHLACCTPAPAQLHYFLTPVPTSSRGCEEGQTQKGCVGETYHSEGRRAPVITLLSMEGWHADAAPEVKNNHPTLYIWFK